MDAIPTTQIHLISEIKKKLADRVRYPYTKTHSTYFWIPTVHTLRIEFTGPWTIMRGRSPMCLSQSKKIKKMKIIRQTKMPPHTKKAMTINVIMRVFSPPPAPAASVHVYSMCGFWMMTASEPLWKGWKQRTEKRCAQEGGGGCRKQHYHFGAVVVWQRDRQQWWRVVKFVNERVHTSTRGPFPRCRAFQGALLLSHPVLSSS